MRSKADETLAISFINSVVTRQLKHDNFVISILLNVGCCKKDEVGSSFIAEVMRSQRKYG